MSPRTSRILLVLLLVTALTACQGPGDAPPSADPAHVTWQHVPLADLAPDLYRFQPRGLVAEEDGFLLLGADGHVLASRDGAKWKNAAPRDGRVTLQALSATNGVAVAAGTRTQEYGETSPVVLRHRSGRSWSRPEVLKSGSASDVVLAVAAGPKGTVVVGHDGGPFDGSEGNHRGHSLRIWTSLGGRGFGVPHALACPQWTDRPPVVGALVDTHGFTVWASCADAQGDAPALLVTSSDGTHWRKVPRPGGETPVAGAVSGNSDAILATVPSGLGDGPQSPTHLWRRDAHHWKGGSPPYPTRAGFAEVSRLEALGGGYLAIGSVRVSDRSKAAAWSSHDGLRWSGLKGTAQGFAPAVGLSGAAEREGTFVVVGTEPSRDDTEPARTHLWVGRPAGHPVAVSFGGLRAFEGSWTWARSKLTVLPDGRFTYRYRLMRPCSDNPPPCDTDYKWGGLVTGKVRAVSEGTLRGKITTSEAPDAKLKVGAAVTVTRQPYQAVRLTLGGTPQGVLCVPGSGDIRCIDVHE